MHEALGNGPNTPPPRQFPSVTPTSLTTFNPRPALPYIVIAIAIGNVPKAKRNHYAYRYRRSCSSSGDVRRCSRTYASLKKAGECILE